MTEAGKKEVLATIERFAPSGSTNLWDGLKTGMGILNDDSTKRPGFSSLLKRSDKDAGRLSTLFVLTDGKTAENPT